jgi:hypothetical protein
MGVDPLAATIPVRSALAALSPGDIVAERYRVEARLGEGTMGVVYRVEHVHMHKTFALKVSRTDGPSLPTSTRPCPSVRS